MFYEMNVYFSRSEQQCEQFISPVGHLHRTSCNESHTFMPFSNNQSVISTRIFQTLTLKNTIKTSFVNTGNANV